MTKKSSSLPELKKTNAGIMTGLTDDGKFVIVVDTTVEIGKSKNGNPLYALTNGFCGTPFGGGLFLSLVVGRDTHAQQ
jgi:hypothetical protein